MRKVAEEVEVAEEGLAAALESIKHVRVSNFALLLYCLSGVSAKWTTEQTI